MSQVNLKQVETLKAAYQERYDVELELDNDTIQQTFDDETVDLSDGEEADIDAVLEALHDKVEEEGDDASDDTDDDEADTAKPDKGKAKGKDEKVKTISAQANKLAGEIADTLAKHEQVQEHLIEAIEAGETRKRTAAVVAHDLLTVFKDDVYGWPRPGSKPSDPEFKGTNNPLTDLSGEVGGASFYKTIANSFPIAKKWAQEIERLKDDDKRDEELVQTDIRMFAGRITGLATLIRTSVKLIHKINEINNLDCTPQLKATIRTMKTKAGSVVMQGTLSVIRISTVGEGDNMRTRYLTSGEFMSLKLQTVKDADDAFAATKVKRGRKNGSAGSDEKPVEIKTPGQAQVTTGEMASAYTDPRMFGDIVKLAMETDNAEFRADLFKLERALGRICSLPNLQKLYKADVEKTAGKEKAA